MTVQHFGKYTRVHDMPSSNQIVYYKVTGEMSSNIKVSFRRLAKFEFHDKHYSCSPIFLVPLTS